MERPECFVTQPRLAGDYADYLELKIDELVCQIEWYKEHRSEAMAEKIELVTDNEHLRTMLRNV